MGVHDRLNNAQFLWEPFQLLLAMLMDRTLSVSTCSFSSTLASVNRSCLLAHARHLPFCDNGDLYRITSQGWSEGSFLTLFSEVLSSFLKDYLLTSGKRPCLSDCLTQSKRRPPQVSFQAFLYCIDAGVMVSDVKIGHNCASKMVSQYCSSYLCSNQIRVVMGKSMLAYFLIDKGVQLQPSHVCHVL